MIARHWLRENFEEGIQWYTEEISRDFSNPEDVKNVASVLSMTLPDEQYQVIDWVEKQQDEPGWSDDVVLALGKSLVPATPSAYTENLVGLISSEEDRATFVSYYVGQTTPSSTFKLRHAPEVLNRLVDAAHLSEAVAARYREVIAAARWTKS